MVEQESLELPDHIRKRLQALIAEINQIIQDGTALIREPLPEKLAFRFEGETGGDILAPYARAQSVSFITRYENLPDDYTIRVVRNGDEFFVGDLHYVRHVLNDYRPIVQNQSDSTYFHRVHNTWAAMLAETDRTRRTTIRALGEGDVDHTEAFIRWLGQHAQAIRTILEPLEFDYLYNGVLQHADPRFSQRFMDDYQSGELNWLYWKHLLALSKIRELLFPYYHLMRFLTFPSMGGL